MWRRRCSIARWIASIGVEIMYSQAERQFIWLSESLGSGSKAFLKALPPSGNLNEIWEEPERILPFMRPTQFKRLMDNRREDWIDSRIEAMEREDVYAVFQMGADFPDPLRFIPDPPSILYVRGQLPDASRHMIGIVGTRRPSRDGLRATKDIARGLSQNGVCVVSGLARGIDSAAHEGCLEGDSPTIAVLGVGHDRCYPPENRDLAEMIVCRGGALISEYPPGTPVCAGNFVKRNRLISGLASGTLLVEGAENSGAMITLQETERQGRVRFALPGSIYQANSIAPNALLQDGAVPVVRFENILSHMGWERTTAPEKKAQPVSRPQGDEGRVLDALDREDLSFGEIAQATGLEAGPLATMLTLMEMRGLVSALPGKVYRKVR